MDQTTYDRVQFLEGINSAYRDAIASLYGAIGRVDSTPGAGDAVKPLKRAITALENTRAPVTKELAQVRAEASARAPKKEGFRGLGS